MNLDFRGDLSTFALRMAKRSRYIFSIEDRNRLQYVVRRPLRTWFVALTAICLLAIFFGIGWLAGYKKGGGGNNLDVAERRQLSLLMARVDSMSQNAALNQAYYNNVLQLLDPDRNPRLDSIRAAKPVDPMPPDSLMGPSDAERKLVSSMQSSTSYHASAIASAAAEIVKFSPLSATGVMKAGSISALDAEFIVPANDPVLAPADGIIIDSYFSSLHSGHTILILHRRGFITRITGLRKTLVTPGETIYAGDAIGFGPASGTRDASIKVRMWHNGIPLPPSRYLQRSNYNDD